MQRINCVKCIHYFVTWQPQHPHGCKAYGIKSKRHPSMEIQASTGTPCQAYQIKNGQ